MLRAGDIGLDPFYKLVFPTMDMLTQEHQDLLNNACDAGDPKEIKATVEIIREALNPHPAGQKTLNAPKKAELTGVQHKYAETVLFFAAAAQTCHAYCTYCFRWAQFIGDADLRFAQKDADSLFDYLEEHEEVSDILFTGGDPMIMKTNMCDLRVLRCCGAFTSLDGLVAVSRCRGWSLRRFRGRSDTIGNNAGSSSTSSPLRTPTTCRTSRTCALGRER